MAQTGSYASRHRPMSSSERPAQPARSCPSTTVKVSPCRRSSAVSPTHKSGWSPWRRTAASFLLISSSVSRKMCRRSECPSSTRRHPSSASIVGEISPVNAPWGCQWQFCAPSPTTEPPSTSATAASAVKGGHTTTSTPRGRLSPSRTDWASARASAKPPCIFQLPTTRGVRMTYPRRGASPPFRSLPPGIVAPAKPALEPRSCRTSFVLRHSPSLGVVEGGHPGELTALKELEEGTARRRDVPDPGRHPHPVNRRDGVAAAHHGESPALADGPRHAQRAGGEGLLLEDPHRPVPDHGLGPLERCRELRDGGRADVQPHEVGRHLSNGHGAKPGEVVHAGGDHHVHWQPQRHAAAPRPLQDGPRHVDPVGLHQGASDAMPERGEES